MHGPTYVQFVQNVFQCFSFFCLSIGQYVFSLCLQIQNITVTLGTIMSNNQNFCILPAQCIYVFRMDLSTNSNYVSVSHSLTALYNSSDVCVLRGTGESLNRADFFSS